MGQAEFDADIEKNLCLICGMCCNGTLFGHATLENYDEAESLVFKGQRILWEEDGWYFRFPCRALDGCACTVYATRPTICRTYHCELLKKYEAGGVSWAEASAIVQEAKPLAEDLLIALRNVVNSKAPLSLKQMYEAFLERHGRRVEMPAFQQKHATLFQNYKKLTLLLDQHFFIEEKT